MTAKKFFIAISIDIHVAKVFIYYGEAKVHTPHPLNEHYMFNDVGNGSIYYIVFSKLSMTVPEPMNE